VSGVQYLPCAPSPIGLTRLPSESEESEESEESDGSPMESNESDGSPTGSNELMGVQQSSMSSDGSLTEPKYL